MARLVEHTRNQNLYQHLQWLVGFSKKPLDVPAEVRSSSACPPSNFLDVLMSVNFLNVVISMYPLFVHNTRGDPLPFDPPPPPKIHPTLPWKVASISDPMYC